tara:strand:+ start:2998 stop:4563 length:1566 start_codon:yes stop_codon:yes gene_type:complete
MNNPLNRRMFRQGGMSKQPIGILASSPELMTTAQKAMMNNQPIKAQNAVSVNLNRPLTASDYVNIGGQINNPNSPLNIKSREMQKMTPTLPNVSKITDYISNVFSSKPDVKSEAEIKTEKILKEKNAPDPMKAKTLGEYINKSIAKQKIIDKENKKLNPNYYSPLLDDKEVDTKEVDTKEVDTKEVDTKKKDVLPDPKLSPITKDATEKDSGVSLSAMIEDIGNIDKVVDEENKKLNNITNENILNKINKVTSDDKKTDSDKAQDLDKLFGIDRLKNKIKAREAILDEIMGSTGSDVRTDPAYVTMMTGLLIASGQDPNALTNIAQGAAKGLLMYGEAAGEDLKERKKIKLVAAKLGFQAQATEDARLAASKAATLKYYRDINLEMVKQGLNKTKRIDNMAKAILSSQKPEMFAGFAEAVEQNNMAAWATSTATDMVDKIDATIGSKKTDQNINTENSFEVKLSNNEVRNVPLAKGFIIRNGFVIKESDKNSKKAQGIPLELLIKDYQSTNKLADLESLFG